MTNRVVGFIQDLIDTIAIMKAYCMLQSQRFGGDVSEENVL
jgi:hypothetical protein